MPNGKTALLGLCEARRRKLAGKAIMEGARAVGRVRSKRKRLGVDKVVEDGVR